MAFKIFVGNLSWNATEDALKQLFAEFGEVVSVRIVADPYTGRSKGFGFIEMSDESSGNQAIEKLDNFEFLGRPIRVSRARQEEGGGGGARGGQRPYRGERGDRGGSRGPRSAGAGSRRSSYNENTEY
jgi:RNA recognition motif-containing protein